MPGGRPKRIRGDAWGGTPRILHQGTPDGPTPAVPLWGVPQQQGIPGREVAEGPPEGFQACSAVGRRATGADIQWHSHTILGLPRLGAPPAGDCSKNHMPHNRGTRGPG
jgi:hypothetical protein